MSAIIKQWTHRSFHDEGRDAQLEDNTAARITFYWELIKKTLSGDCWRQASENGPAKNLASSFGYVISCVPFVVDVEHF